MFEAPCKGSDFAPLEIGVSACIIFNPAARGEKSRRFLRHLEEIGRECALRPTTCGGDARRLAREAVGEGFTTIVAAGGDGTLNEVLNGICDAPDGLTKARLGVIPLGTVNVFAREFRIPTNVHDAWEVIRADRETRIDLPEATFLKEGRLERRAFAQMAGAGWDAHAVSLVNWELKKKHGQMAYVIAGLQALVARQSSIEVASEDRIERGELVLVGNGKFYGGSFSIFHQAEYTDGWLDVCVFPKINLRSLPQFAIEFATGNLFSQQTVKYFKTRTLKLRSESETALQLEGELVGSLPAEITLRPGALRVAKP